jgi:hypothetical protein
MLERTGLAIRGSSLRFNRRPIVVRRRCIALPFTKALAADAFSRSLLLVLLVCEFVESHRTTATKMMR